MALVSGEYTAKEKVRVIVWPEADHLGTGPQVVEEIKDEAGRSIGRRVKKDEYNREVRQYLPPEGFLNLPSFDHTDNYVMVDHHGQPVRTPSGKAIVIKQGQALIIRPDGEYDVLTGSYDQYLWEQSYNQVNDEVSGPDSGE